MVMAKKFVSAVRRRWETKARSGQAATPGTDPSGRPDALHPHPGAKPSTTPYGRRHAGHTAEILRRKLLLKSDLRRRRLRATRREVARRGPLDRATGRVPTVHRVRCAAERGRSRAATPASLWRAARPGRADTTDP